jgi:ubiquinone/menaquinone biosynthesis C-methylase UbiE
MTTSSSTESLDSRVQREKEIHNDGLERGAYKTILSHVNQSPSRHRRQVLIKEIMRGGAGRAMLELGSGTWGGWVDFQNAPPSRLTCINISEKELEDGVAAAKRRGLDGRVEFRVADAHRLNFPDHTFDVVFGSDILHHLDFKRGVDEMCRVLKPGGFVLFKEPLIHNPVARSVRLLTPRARTADERPLSRVDLAYLGQKLRTCLYFYQLFAVPAGVVSRFGGMEPINGFTLAVDKLDQFLERGFPFLRPYFRSVLIHGVKPTP